MFKIFINRIYPIAYSTVTKTLPEISNSIDYFALNATRPINIKPPTRTNIYVESHEIASMSEEQVVEYRKSMNITVTGRNVPRPINSFDQLEKNFPSSIITELKKSFSVPTPIQCQGWPMALSSHDMVGIAQTGSGKTLSYILPALVRVINSDRTRSYRSSNPCSLILAPTRELAVQIHNECEKFSKFFNSRSICIYGGASKNAQLNQLERTAADIVISTPGRLIDILNTNRSPLNLQKVSFLVLDEADRMLDMGFEDQIREILSFVPNDQQKLLWSATWPKEIQTLANEFLSDYNQVVIGSSELSANPNVKQIVKVCKQQDKFDLLLLNLNNALQTKQKILIFTATKRSADQLCTDMKDNGFDNVVSIHGDKPQYIRDQCLQQFRSGSSNIMVATDVAARGLDIKDITLVINYDFPNTIQDYIHRIGRTGRAGSTGTAISYFTMNDKKLIEKLIQTMKDANQYVNEELINMSHKTFQKIAYRKRH